MTIRQMAILWGCGATQMTLERGDLIKITWHDGLGMPLYAKRLEKGRFIWRRLPMAWSGSRLAIGLSILCY